MLADLLRSFLIELITSAVQPIISANYQSLCRSQTLAALARDVYTFVSIGIRLGFFCLTSPFDREIVSGLFALRKLALKITRSYCQARLPMLSRDLPNVIELES